MNLMNKLSLEGQNAQASVELLTITAEERICLSVQLGLIIKEATDLMLSDKQIARKAKNAYHKLNKGHERHLNRQQTTIDIEIKRVKYKKRLHSRVLYYKNRGYDHRISLKMAKEDLRNK